MDTLDTRRKEAYRSLITAHARLNDTIDRQLTEAGLLPLSWYDVLVTLEYEPGGALRMSDLADRVLLSKSGLTRLVDRLVENGYVTRAFCPNDRRGTFAVLTDAGRRAREETWPLYASLIQSLFGSQVSDEEADTVRKALDRTVKAVKEFQRNPRLSPALREG